MPMPPRRPFDDLANKLIIWIGSKQSIFLHTFLFAGAFALAMLGFDLDKVLLVLTTLVSLEAIYLGIFIQYSVNQHSRQLQDVAEDIEEVAEDIEGVEEDMEDISEDVEKLGKAEKTEITNYQHLEEHLNSLLDEVRRFKEEKAKQPPAPPAEN